MDGKGRARRVEAIESPPPGLAAPDYADAFEVPRRPDDPRSAEGWARDGFGRLPLVTRHGGLLAHRFLLGFGLGPWDSPDHVFGWRVVSTEPEVLHLEARSGWLGGHMVWRRHDAALVMNTFVTYKTAVGSLIWETLGGVHRASTPYLLALAATAPEAR